MRSNPVRAKLSAGRTAWGMMSVEFFTPGFTRIIANAGAEFVIFDGEHGAIGIDTLKSQIAYARGAGIVPLVRVPGLHYHLIAPVLDAGAMGIMVPMIETREQAENLAKWCRYRPDGVRGIGFGMAHDDYKGGAVTDLTRLANDRTLVIALIETATGIANADAILSVPGIDVGWLGHYDLSDSMGIPGQFDNPLMHEAVATLLAACNRHGKPAGYLATSVAMAREWQAKGFRCLCYHTDAGLLQSALAEALKALKED